MLCTADAGEPEMAGKILNKAEKVSIHAGHVLHRLRTYISFKRNLIKKSVSFICIDLCIVVHKKLCKKTVYTFLIMILLSV